MFGTVSNGRMIHNEAGMMVKGVLEKAVAYHRGITMTNMAVMPNHLHCIIGISADGDTGISGIIRYFKSKTTVEYIRGVKEKGWKRFDGKLWQFRFYDHIIRNQHSYDKINEYILLNPERWDKDKLNAMCGDDADDINSMIKECESRCI